MDLSDSSLALLGTGFTTLFLCLMLDTPQGPVPDSIWFLAGIYIILGFLIPLAGDIVAKVAKAIQRRH